jgi:hypothetical protein
LSEHCFSSKAALLSIRAGWATTSIEVLGEDAVGREGGREPIGFLAHVGPDECTEVLDQLLTAAIQLLVVLVDLGL